MELRPAADIAPVSNTGCNRCSGRSHNTAATPACTSNNIVHCIRRVLRNRPERCNRHFRRHFRRHLPLPRLACTGPPNWKCTERCNSAARQGSRKRPAACSRCRTASGRKGSFRLRSHRAPGPRDTSRRPRAPCRLLAESRTKSLVTSDPQRGRTLGRSRPGDSFHRGRRTRTRRLSGQGRLRRPRLAAVSACWFPRSTSSCWGRR